MIGIGFAGVGGLGEALVHDACRNSDLQVVGIQDARADVAESIAQQYGVAWHGDDFEALLVRPDMDAVAISTPNALHADQAQAALRAGKHVLVQKPLALTFADAESTIDLARQTGRLLFIDYSYRFLDTVRLLREYADAPLALRAEFHNIFGPGSDKPWFFDRQRSGGGALIDLGVHFLDLALWLVQPRSVYLESADLDGQPVESSGHLALRLDNTPFDLQVSWNAPIAATSICFEADTAAARVHWQNVDGSFFHFRVVRNGSVLLDRETTLREDTLRAFCAALKEGHAPPIDARVYALLDQAYTAVRTPRAGAAEAAPGAPASRRY